MKGGNKVEPIEEEHFKQTLKRSLSIMELWLSKTKFIASEEISIADISAICELKTFDFFGGDLSKYPKIQAWMTEMFKIPEVKEVHIAHEKMVKLSQGMFEAKL